MRAPEERHLTRRILEFIHAHAHRHAADQAFDELALAVFHFQYAHNSVYRRWCVVKGIDTRSVREWRAIPALPAAAFKEFTVTSFPAKQAVRVFRTSGTTSRSSGRHLFRSLDLYDASISAPFAEHLLPDGIRPTLFFLILSEKDAPASSLSHMMRRIQAEFGRSKGRHYVHPRGTDYPALYRDLSACKNPAMILGTAFSLAAFLEYLEDRGLSVKLPPRSRIMETGGFKGRFREVPKEWLYGRCRELLGVREDHIVSEYGMTELSSQCYGSALADHFAGRERRPVMQLPAWMRAEVISPVTGRAVTPGREGLVKFVDLANLGSVAAVQTEDLARVRTDGFELLGRASGSAPRGCSLSYEDLLGGIR